MEGRYDAVRGHRTGSNHSPPLSVPVSPSPVSREGSREFVALDMWLHTRYQMSKINLWYHMVYLVYLYFWVWIDWVGYNFLLSRFEETKRYNSCR